MAVEINQTKAHSARISLVMPIFALALFTSAALLFWVQPLIAKILLPSLGGAASVWNTCMVFFQTLLLAGYAYVVLLSKRLSFQNQVLVHVALLILAALSLPFSLPSSRLSSLPVDGTPVFWLLGTLFLVVGPPFFVISATAPLLQRWLSLSKHPSAKDPYFLYAVSNAGSMLALMAFPFVLEPTLAIRLQTKLWAAGYLLLVLAIVGCAFVLRDSGQALSSFTEEKSRIAVGNKRRLNWILLAFIPSSLMLGVTTFIATDIASVPLVWIIPLALYLLTFILAFSNQRILSLPVASHLLPLTIFGLGAFIILSPNISAWVAILLHLCVFFVAAFISHSRLALDRPAVANLTEYYLWIAVGGVLGGIFNALVAPLIFSTALEYPIVVVLACLMRPDHTAAGYGNKRWWVRVFPMFVFLLTIGLSQLASRSSGTERMQSAIALFIPLVICYVVTLRRPALFALTLVAFLFGALPFLNASDKTLVSRRNFFGIWRVTSNKNEDFRRLWHGSTVHGVQFNDANRKCVATSYYSNDGPLGQIFEAFNKGTTVKTVAATGLGSGTVASYATTGQRWDFYEIDPAIIGIVSDSRYFTFLSECSKAPYRVILGDARLKLREAPQGQYGLIVMDAFSSDSVPAHLLTTEAFDLYLSKLADDGLLAFHISNRYLDLEPLLSGVAKQTSLVGRFRHDDDHSVVGRYPSIWVVFARNDAALGDLIGDKRWRPLQGDVVWTDDFSNILSLLK